ncbi:MAG: triose-phosphate isomerase [Deltaproteobacteria bacterium]|nr:triose-phosphate isomerase [Deltaproteobacteria bacterium]
MARRKLIAGNWKMNPSLDKGIALASEVAEGTRGLGVDVLVIPPACFVPAIGQAIAGTHVALGAQNLHPERAGAYTGEIAGSMWVELGVRYVLCGHSERRQLFGESPAFVGAKVRAAVRDGLVPILCVGETLDERERGVTEAVVGEQLDAGLEGLAPAQIAEIVIAYEPVWAIGTGRNATPEQAQAVHHYIRASLGERIGRELADELRILYGGSVKPANARDLLGQPDIDGALVGGASLEAEGFVAIARAGA